MYNNLYITATEALVGKSAVVLGMMQLLTRKMHNVAFFRPIINEPPKGHKDHSINLILQQFKLDQDYASTYAYTLEEARHLINTGRRNLMLETILQKFRALTSSYEFVLCEGTDFLGKESTFEFELNADIALNMGCLLMLVANGCDKSFEELSESTQLFLSNLYSKNLDVLSLIINQADLSETEKQEIRTRLRTKYKDAAPLVYAIPNDPGLSKPTVEEIARWLDAEVLYGAKRMDNQVSDYLIAAMQVPNFLQYLSSAQLIITPGDRTDIIVASLASRMSSSTPDIAGILLTGGIHPTDTVQNLIEGWSGAPVPVLLTQHHTYNTVRHLSKLYARIQPQDTRKINTTLGLFEHHVNGEELSQRLISSTTKRITPMMFEFNLLERARQNPMRIVLAEGEEERILLATDTLLRRNVAEIILLGHIDAMRAKARDLGLDISGARLIQPDASPDFDAYAETYFQLRQAKGVTLEQARDRMMDPTYFATMMVYKDHADGMVSGAVNTTAHTIRPSFEFIKTRKGCSIVSSVFLMCLKDRVLVFGDCAVNPNPTAQQLAEIAISSAQTAKVFGVEPRVAMLSYSTGSSGKGADVDVVKEATQIARELAPDLLLEGPLQYDAAIDPTVAQTKLPDSKVAGRATVFIFPDLNTGNNTYKAVQRAAGAIAIGPVLQGLNKPVNDLSRGCTVPDIVNTVAITAVQAAAQKAAAQK